MINRVILIFLFMISLVNAQSVNLPLEHWAYSFFERMEARSILSGIRDGTRPVSRQKASGWVEAISKFSKSHPRLFSEVENDIIERLKGEFSTELQGASVQIKHKELEPHLYSWMKASSHVQLDALGGGRMILRNREAAADERNIYSAFMGGILRGRLWNIGFYSDNRIHTEWGRSPYIQHYQASQGYPQNVETAAVPPGILRKAIWHGTVKCSVFNLAGIVFDGGPLFMGGCCFQDYRLPLISLGSGPR